MNEHLLITIVKNHPILYDKRRSDFRDTIQRTEVWNIISNTFNISAEDCMRTWRNIRERYAKELKALKSTSGTSIKNESRWNLFDSLSFLKPYIKPRMKHGLLSVEWTSTTNESLLIEQVKKYPVLYDKHCEDFKNSAKKENAWDSVAEVLSLPVADCMRLWKNLRERYGKQLKLMKNSSDYSLHECKWDLFEKLSFLKSHIKQRKVFSKLHSSNKGSPACTESSEDNTAFVLKYNEINKKEDPFYAEEAEDQQTNNHDEEDFLQNNDIVSDETVQEYIMLPTSSGQHSNKTIIQTAVEEHTNSVLTKNQFLNSDLTFGNYIGQYLSEIVDIRKKNKLKINIIQLLHNDDN